MALRGLGVRKSRSLGEELTGVCAASEEMISEAIGKASTERQRNALNILLETRWEFAGRT